MNVEQELSEVKKDLQTLIELVTRMNSGLYGDDKNGFIGVISRQAVLERDVEQLKRDMSDQRVATLAKKSLGTKIVEFVKWAALITLVIKGVIGVDALF